MTVRKTGLLAMAMASGLALSACGSDTTGQQQEAQGAPPAANTACFSGTLPTSGSSAQDNAMQEWIKKFQGVCPEASINYQPVGSGAGLESFVGGQTAFAGSDSALKEEQVAQAQARCAGTPAINIPMVTGPIAIAYNLPGVMDLTLDASTLAKIFQGQISTWNDPAITALNPGAQLPATPIRAIHRSDSSGTTENFTDYLAAAAEGVWTTEPGKEWTAPGGEGAAKSAGVTQAVQSAAGGITYVESSFAENAGITKAKIDTGGGAPVELTPESAGAAVAAATIEGQGNDLALEIDYATKAPGAYPIVLVTYEITCEKGLPQDQATAVKNFLTYTASEEGQQILTNLGYAPLPADIATRVRPSVEAIAPA